MASRAQFKTPTKNKSENIEPSTELKSASQYADTNFLTYRYEWGDEDVYNEAESPPNINNILDNVTSFVEENHTVYLGDDEIPESLMEGTHWTLLQVNLTALYVRDDKDALSMGDIYARWAPNIGLVYLSMISIIIGIIINGLMNGPLIMIFIMRRKFIRFLIIHFNGLILANQ